MSTSTVPYEKRSSTHPLSAYLFRLMTVKQSNLCLSADVTSASTLLSLAAALGPSIVILKTHYDIVTDWDSNPKRGTGAQLAALARKHGFLIFEDRKYSDIGSTVQKQYTDGPGRVVEWAHITNAHILPGAAIVTALAEAASKWQERQKCEVRTDISTGTPRPESQTSEEEEGAPAASGAGSLKSYKSASPRRKASIISVTTVSQHFESADSPARSTPFEEDEEPFPDLEEAPTERGLLLLAQMSSAGNFFNKAYTQACVDIARENKGFVMGYISQESLNTDAQDQFMSMTPGCQLPPKGQQEVVGDGLGQQYNTPERLIGEKGNDIIIVGRGIIKAADPVAEAERYRIAGWEAYENRTKESK